jgi:uncharacterized membrane protein YkoI
MKSYKIVLLCLYSFCVFIPSVLWAKESEAMNTSIITSITHTIEKEGYVGIRKIKFKHDLYYVEVFTKQGQRAKLRLDSKTYALLDPSQNKMSLTLLEITQKIESAGFTKIYLIESEDEGYIVTASNKNRKKVRLFINAFTGDITDSFFNYLR